ncbi:hypothetical protein BFP72_06355 [Reichenbachiella sp. 5M10]|uniref:hypothetical protein n=1 Tax=Reichenbachiella sp. 5M10 TaxID=1889772 RepID=UPI000C15AB03|nr:hypothetical protein [Reichenbachiella sp. 5M10]PIB35043.1 hypothetical protein BFP72_06355 [Reichenbachiella sp. 5M10]
MLRKITFGTMVWCLLLLHNLETRAQGCSDAGFCTMGAMKPDQQYSKNIDFKLRSVEINAYRGSTTLTPIIYVLTADMTFAITDRLFVQGKIPYQAVEGNLGNTKGLGDISLSMTRHMMTLAGGSLSATIGAKIPSNHSDLDKDSDEFLSEGSDYPMYYQVSLGSYDAILGGSWINEKWLIATGIQIALTENQNDFRWGQWPGYPDGEIHYDENGEVIIDPYIEEYALANNLKRGIDVMVRLERNFRFTNFNFNVGLLPIYRITHDERLDFNTNKRIKIDGTTGLALSALAGAGYSFDVKNSIKLIWGIKLKQRDVNPDGLTRKMVTSVSYVYRF